MSIKHLLVGLCVTAAALTATVTTVSAAGREAGLAARPTSGALVVSPAAAVGAAAAGSTTPLFAARNSPAFDDAALATAAEEALPASNLLWLALAALLSIGLLMTRRSGRG